MQDKKLKSRLARLDRLFTDHPVFFVTMCIDERKKVLNNNAIHTAMCKFGQEGMRRGCYLGRYVLMPDHLHAFVVVKSQVKPTTIALSGWVKALKGCLSKVWRENGIDDVRWQKGFFDHVLRSSESYSSKWQYVALNPVRAELVKEQSDWPYQGEIVRLEM